MRRINERKKTKFFWNQHAAGLAAYIFLILKNHFYKKKEKKKQMRHKDWIY